MLCLTFFPSFYGYGVCNYVQIYYINWREFVFVFYYVLYMEGLPTNIKDGMQKKNGMQKNGMQKNGMQKNGMQKDGIKWVI